MTGRGTATVLLRAAGACLAALVAIAPLATGTAAAAPARTAAAPAGTGAAPAGQNAGAAPASADGARATAGRATGAAANGGKGPVGWDAYRRLDQAPTLPNGVQTRQFSSFDRTGGNDDFSHCLRTTSDGCVIADRKGPGEIDSVWFTRDGGDVAKTGNITIRLDGRTVLHAPLSDVVNGRLGAPFVRPLVANADQSSGGACVLVPMPFRSSMRITTDVDPIYYHVTYRTFTDASGVRTFDPADRATDVIAKLRAAGSQDPKPAAADAVTRRRDLPSLAPGGTATLADAAGPGAVDALRLRLPQLAAAARETSGSTARRAAAAADDVLRHARLRASFDGHRTVDAPLGQFFGSGLGGGATVNGLMFAIDPKTGWLSAWWPMPYRDRVTVSLVNDAHQAITGASARVTTARDARWATALAPDGDAGYFHATTHSGPTTPGQDHVFLDTAGRGKFVGVSTSMRGPTTRGYLEGDERIYADGARTPQLHGTGTEDFYEGGWYFNKGTFSDPLNGEPDHRAGTGGCPADADCTAAYRQLLADAVPFRSSLDAGIEHGGQDDVQADYSSTAFWYGQDAPTARWTDQLDVGDRRSEAAHAYASTAPGDRTELAATFEGQDTPQLPVTEDLRASTAPVTFRLAVDPANQGVVLRRTSDQAHAYQSAAVSVDGRPAGTWLEPLGNAEHRWLDDAYPLPSRLTAGRGQVTITLTPTQGAPAWSAERYQAISLGGPFADRQPPAPVTGLAARGRATNAVSVRWQPARDDVYAPRYQVYASTEPGFRPTAGNLVATTAATSFTETGLPPHQTRYYRVRSVDRAGHVSRASAAVSARSGDTVRLEGESLLPAVDATAPADSQGNCCGVSWSGGAQLWFHAAKAGDRVTVPFDVPAAGCYAVSAVLTTAPDYGTVRLAVDGSPVGRQFDGYHPQVAVAPPQDEGRLILSAGRHLLTLEVTGKNAASTGYLAGLDHLDLRSAG